MRKGESGVTLVELLVVVSIIGILVVALGMSFQGWRENYRIESQTKSIYADLMDARARAMTRHRDQFIVLSASQYTMYDDTDPSPDGDGALDTSADDQVLQKKIDNYTLSSTPALPATVTVNVRGFLSPNMFFRVVHTGHPDYDCVNITRLRVRMGKYNGTICEDR